MSKKLEQVLEHLIANDEAKAKELLHQVFIEKARKIHEELISQDELDEMEHLGGDEGEELEDEIKLRDDDLESDLEEIDAEETMSEDADDTDMMDMGDVDVADAGDDMADAGDDMADAGDDMADAGDEAAGDDVELDDIEATIGNLEDALAELKAEFEKLEAGEQGGEEDLEAGEEDLEAGEEDTDDAEEDLEADDEEDAEEDSEEDEEEMDESWLEEDFDDLAEAIELEKVSVPTSGEVGSGKGQGAPSEKSKSPIATSQTSRMGAKPVKVDSKDHSGYNKETAPGSKDMGLKNQRKSAEAGMAKVSKEGDKAAAINKTASEFGADTVGKNSPLSKSPRK